MRALPFVLLASLLAGCGSSSDGGSSSPAVTQCNQVIDAACTAFERCGKSTKAACLSQSAGIVDCSRAVSTTSNLQACLDTLPKVDCATYPPLPDVCKGVILVKDRPPASSGAAKPMEPLGHAVDLVDR